MPSYVVEIAKLFPDEKQGSLSSRGALIHVAFMLLCTKNYLWLLRLLILEKKTHSFDIASRLPGVLSLSVCFIVSLIVRYSP